MTELQSDLYSKRILTAYRSNLRPEKIKQKCWKSPISSDLMPLPIDLKTLCSGKDIL